MGQRVTWGGMAPLTLKSAYDNFPSCVAEICKFRMSGSGVGSYVPSYNASEFSTTKPGLYFDVHTSIFDVFVLLEFL